MTVERVIRELTDSLVGVRYRLEISPDGVISVTVGDLRVLISEGRRSSWVYRVLPESGSGALLTGRITGPGDVRRVLDLIR